MNRILIAVLYLVTISVTAVLANEPPHNANSGVTCDGCHGAVLFSTPPSGVSSEMYDAVCMGTCHNFTGGSYHGPTAPAVAGHQDAKCIDCHQPHYQLPQISWGAIMELYLNQPGFMLVSGTATDAVPDHDPGRPRTVITYDPGSLLVKENSSWDTGDPEEALARLAAKTSDGRGALLLPDANDPENSMMIESVNTEDGGEDPNSMTVKGTLGYVPDRFAIVYGQLINRDLLYEIDNVRVSTPVVFLDNTGKYSFAHNDGKSGGDDSTPDGICQVCHHNTGHWLYNGTETDHHSGENCTKSCHLHTDGFLHGGVVGGGESCATATYCHGGSHYTHLSGMLPGTECDVCHDLENLRDESDNILFKDGKVLSETGVCEPCHSTDGASLAKQYFANLGSNTRTAGSWAVEEGEKSYCGSCHDATPGYNDVTAAPNILGDDSAYGFYITGHGKETGNYQKLSWQDSAETATGNPAANLQRCDQCHGMPPVEDGWPVPPDPPDIPGVTPCGFCHDLTAQHFAGSTKRLRTGFENDQANSNCKNCHSSDGSDGTAAISGPDFYTNSAEYESSAHKDKLCTDCHDVHGASGAYIGMMKENQEYLCDNCHNNGGHPGVGSATFTHNAKNYTLECVSCHNVHVVSGTYAQADQNKTPVSKFSDNMNAWGDEADEKMEYYAGSGTYQAPNGESFTGAELPDYASFCTDCHSQPGDPPFGIDWSYDPHGKSSAGIPYSGGTCPDWYTCGKASGWDGDDCVAANPDDCWPVMTRGKGEQLWSRSAYSQEDRVSGANYTLSCTDCHTGHGSGTLGRTNVNGGSFSGTWNSMCNNCHYYYSDWHAGMSCGNASCHVSSRMNFSGSTPHEMSNTHRSGGTKTFDPDLVLNLQFDNNLNDSGTWRMHSKWMDDISGSYAAGKSGQAVVLNGGKNIQVGTRNEFWTTDEGHHGTWKYTEMKFNTTLEAWVYPTADQDYHSIFTKHVGYSNGGYEFALKKIDGALRAVFYMQADNNGTDDDGMAGVRGAYSSITIPLNSWTHVAATFDTAGPDGDTNDLSVGRIRIYVNGEDVTASDISGNNMQPGTDETSIYAYSENNDWNASVCYNGSWCASEFSVGGFYGWQYEFVGRLDEAKVWNITKDAAYFSAYDSQAGPFISSVQGLIGSTQLTVTFSEGVYANTGGTGNLDAADLILSDTNGDNPRTITGVVHTAGSDTATLTMSQPLTAADTDADTLAAVASSIYDNYDNAAGTATVTISLSDQCPAAPVELQFDETSGSSFIMDSQDILYGAVYGSGTLTGSEFSGDGVNSYVDFDYNSSCLQADTAMTLETRIKPVNIGTDNYINRVLDRTAGGNYQLSVWRNNSWTDYNAPDGVASMALWVYVADNNGGSNWKVVLTDYDACPIVSDHWYQVKTVWDSAKSGGTPGEFFVPADFYIDDQGTDGADSSENWSGTINCTNTSQSYNDDTQKFYTGDEIKVTPGSFVIGANASNQASNVFDGLIDWIRWQDSVE